MRIPVVAEQTGALRHGRAHGGVEARSEALGAKGVIPEAIALQFDQGVPQALSRSAAAGRTMPLSVSQCRCRRFVLVQAVEPDQRSGDADSLERPEPGLNKTPLHPSAPEPCSY